MNSSLLSQLKSIGFTELEAVLYISLLESDTELTGYAIAKLIDKPAANVYMALSSLTNKGAILCSEYSKTKQYFPVPINDYLSLVEIESKRQHAEIIKSTKKYSKHLKSEIFYNIESVGQSFIMANQIISRAKNILLIDISFNLINEIEDEIKLAIERGVNIYIKTTQKGNINACNYIIPRMSSPRLSETPFRWIEVSADLDHYILANFSKNFNQVSSGVYCHGKKLAYKLYSGLAHEIMVTQLSEILESTIDDKLKENFLNLTHTLLWETGAIDAFDSAFEAD